MQTAVLNIYRDQIYSLKLQNLHFLSPHDFVIVSVASKDVDEVVDDDAVAGGEGVAANHGGDGVGQRVNKIDLEMQS